MKNPEPFFDESQEDRLSRENILKTEVRAFPEALSKELVSRYVFAIEKLTQKISQVREKNAFDAYFDGPKVGINATKIEKLEEQRELLRQDIQNDFQELLTKPSFYLENRILEEEMNFIDLITELFALKAEIDYINPDAREQEFGFLIQDLNQQKILAEKYYNIFEDVKRKIEQN